MHESNKIVFSNRAFNSIVCETYDRIATETGGILLGSTIDGIWYVVEVIDPGPGSIFTISYFEYDTAYVNHLAKVISKQYEIELAVLGLWHRHPGCMDTFSLTDNITNTEFSKLLPKGALSGLVNIDPLLRLTMYHVSFPLKYTKLPFEIGDHLFPSGLLKYTHSFSQKSSYSGMPQPAYEATLIIEKPNPVRSIFNKFVYPIFRKFKTTGVRDSYSPNISNAPGMKEKDEDHLIDLYAYEELQLESNFKAKYESEVKDNKIIYKINELGDGLNPELPIFFTVNLDPANPIFQCTDIDYKFSPGIFTRYVDSKIENKQFKG